MTMIIIIYFIQNHAKISVFLQCPAEIYAEFGTVLHSVINSHKSAL